MKDFLKQKGIKIDNDIYSFDGRKYRLSELLTDYAKYYELQQNNINKYICNYCLEMVDELPDKFGCKNCINKYK